MLGRREKVGSTFLHHLYSAILTWFFVLREILSFLSARHINDDTLDPE